MGLREGIRRAIAVTAAGVFLSISLSGCDPSLWIICGVGACEEGTDYFPPETPQDVRATPFSKGVEISWRRSADEKIRFLVFRTTTPGRDYALIADTSNEVTTFDDVGTTEAGSSSAPPTRLENGTTYYYI